MTRGAICIYIHMYVHKYTHIDVVFEASIKDIIVKMSIEKGKKKDNIFIFVPCNLPMICPCLYFCPLNSKS